MDALAYTPRRSGSGLIIHLHPALRGSWFKPSHHTPPAPLQVRSPSLISEPETPFLSLHMGGFWHQTAG